MTNRHVEECERCRALQEWAPDAAAYPDSPPDQRKKIQDKLKASLTRVSPRRSIGGLAARFLIAFCVIVPLAIAMMGTAGFKEMTTGQATGMMAVLIAGVVLTCVSLAWQMTPGSLRRYTARALVPAIAGSFILSVMVLFPWQAPEEFLSRGSFCLRTGLLVASPAAVLFVLLVRHGMTLDFPSMGASLGAIAGLSGITMLQFRCTYQDVAHLSIWHAAVLAFSIGLGFVIATALQFRSIRRRP